MTAIGESGFGTGPRPLWIDVRKALTAIGSLISKSEKTLRRLDSDTWQHAMLQDSLKALRLAQALLDQRADDVSEAPREDLRQGLCALDATIGRVERAKALAPGTSAHTLQRNRLNALRIARAAMEAELARR